MCATLRKGKPKAKFGDIYEVQLSKGVAYVQYVFRHTAGRETSAHGPLIRVLPGLFKTPLSEPAAIAEKEERFVAFYWVPGAINDGDFKQVGAAPVQERFKKCPLFKNGAAENWRLWDGDTYTLVDPFPPQYFDLPTTELVPHSGLVNRIESGWHPRDEVFSRNPQLREVYEEWKRSRETA